MTRPEYVRQYGRQQWMDPGEPEVRKISLDVILDVVRRYDIDGVHVDDYFYPYKVNDAGKRPIDFPDQPSWEKYRRDGGRLSRDDWRRSNIDTFVETMYNGVKKLKPWVKVGISPFGIWRPGNPPVIQGLDPYEELYADSRKWFRNGWVDYFTPQLYWSTSRPHQSYPVLLSWWAGQNVKHRHLWPGNSLSNGAEEIVNQVNLTRKQPGATGNVFFDMGGLMRDRGGVATALQAAYSEPALVPASPWLGGQAPAMPDVRLERATTAQGDTENAVLSPAGGTAPWLWVVRTCNAGHWTTQILPGSQASCAVGAVSALADGDTVVVSAVDRTGNESAPAVAVYHMEVAGR